MTSQIPPDRIDAIRAASRRLVRELGFMGGDFAGTELSPSAVHALIEVEAGGVTARDLAERLRLEKSSVSRMLRKLVEAGEVAEQGAEDGRVKRLSLTDRGKQRVSGIHSFARTQVEQALAQLEPGGAQQVLNGLELYAAALSAPVEPPAQGSAVQILQGYQTGLIARITQMHALYYNRTSGFGQRFESVVAAGLAEFCNRLENPRNAIWTAVQGEAIIGSIAIDGEDLGDNLAHLRWFIVDDNVRGSGAGGRLLSTALQFVEQQGFAATHLWTFSGLNAARHLYETRGFTLVEERPGAQWGNEVLEQKFTRSRP